MSFRNKNDAEYSLLCGDYTKTPVILSLTTALSRSTELPRGTYELWSPDCEPIFIQGGATISGAAATAVKIMPGMKMHFNVTGASNAYIASTLSAGTGTLYIVRK